MDKGLKSAFLSDNGHAIGVIIYNLLITISLFKYNVKYAFNQ